MLEKIQGRLQELGSHIATPRTKAGPSKLARTPFPQEYTDGIERDIDALDDDLPQLTTFILASGGKASASLHCCRSVARRAERTLAPLLQTDDIDPAAYAYVNRVSDFLFTAARTAARFEGNEEVIYTPPMR